MIDPERIGADGRTVRCAACRGTWFAGPEVEDGDEDPAEADAFKAFLAEQSRPQPGLDAASPTEIMATAHRTLDDRDAEGPSPTPSAARAPRSSRGVRVPSGFLLMGLWIALAALLVAGRERIVRALPQTARLYAGIGLGVNLRGLELAGVSSRLVTADGGPVLVVEGEIRNVAGREAAIPGLELSVQGADGRTLYTWTNETPRRTLGTAQAERFRARLAAPPAEAREVLVRFTAAPEDAPAAARVH